MGRQEPGGRGFSGAAVIAHRETSERAALKDESLDSRLRGDCFRHRRAR